LPSHGYARYTPKTVLMARDGVLHIIGRARRGFARLGSLGRPASVKTPAAWQVHSSNIDQRVVLITGSTRGIGRAAASLFAERGAQVAVHGRSQEAAERCAAEIRALGGTARGYGADLTVPGQAAGLVERVVRDFAGLDVLVNNCAVLPPNKLAPWASDLAEFRDVLATNVSGPFEACAAAMAWMQRSGRHGRIVNISSPVADLSRELAQGLLAYGVSKVALEGLSHYLAREAQTTGIVVTTLRVPTTNTEMIRTHVPWEARPMTSTPASVAELYLWAATAPSSEVNGRVHAG